MTTTFTLNKIIDYVDHLASKVNDYKEKDHSQWSGGPGSAQIQLIIFCHQEYFLSWRQGH